jgi:hypothetical protein
MKFRYSKALLFVTIIFWMSLACQPGFLARDMPTATPTKTPKPPPTNTPDPSQITDTPVSEATPTLTPLPTDTPTAEATATEIPAEEPTNTPVPEEPTPTETPIPEPTNTPVPAEPTATPEPTETPVPAEAYQIVHYKVLGEGENNGGIFNKGGQHLIFLTVLDENGQGLDGAVVKDANGHNLEVVTGSKGPGKAEISMEWDPYKLYVAADPSGPTTSQVSNQMNNAFPHIPDVVGKLGPADNPASVCPTIDFQCEPPFYSVHFSYEITFQKVLPQ